MALATVGQQTIAGLWVGCYHLTFRSMGSQRFRVSGLGFKVYGFGFRV